MEESSRRSALRREARRANELEELTVRGTLPEKHSAAHEVAKKFFDAGAFAGIFLFGDGSGLVAKFEAEDGFLEGLKLVGDLFIDGGDWVGGGRGLRG